MLFVDVDSITLTASARSAGGLVFSIPKFMPAPTSYSASHLTQSSPTVLSPSRSTIALSRQLKMSFVPVDQKVERVGALPSVHDANAIEGLCNGPPVQGCAFVLGSVELDSSRRKVTVDLTEGICPFQFWQSDSSW